ncbi:MAG: ATP-binding protein [Elusimicrobiota bacterium]
MVSVLLLLFLYQPGAGDMVWSVRLAFLLLPFIASLILIQRVPEAMLERGWFQVGVFLGDAAVAAVVLSWTSSSMDLFLIYTFILFGTALIRSFRQAMVVAGITVALYLASGWHSSQGFPSGSEFWLRALFLLVATALLAILSRDSAQAQEDIRRRQEERLIQIERMATLGRVAAEVAHRIKSPLTTIAVNAEVIAHRHRKDRVLLGEISQIGEEVERCKEILKTLLDLGRIEEMDRERVDLNKTVERAIRRMRPQIKASGARVSSRAAQGGLEILGDESMLQEAVCVLLQNAVEAVVPGGCIEVETQTKGACHIVSVIDDGPGVARANQVRIFEPFFTTKKEGSGLGLSAALRIAQKHGGTIEVESGGENLGSRFKLILPAA